MDGYDIIRFDTLDSTNDHIKNNLEDLKDHMLVLASSQTQGRGRRERIWESEPEKNFLGSFYKVQSSVTPYQSMIEGVLTVVFTLESLGVEAFIKPPNDVYVKDRKIAGVLAEIIHKQDVHVIIGIGLNVNEHKVAPAIALADINGTTHDLDRVVGRVKESMEKIEKMDRMSKIVYYRQKIPFNRILAYNDSIHGPLKSIDDAFICTVGEKSVPCESLNFEYR